LFSDYVRGPLPKLGLTGRYMPLMGTTKRDANFFGTETVEINTFEDLTASQAKGIIRDRLYNKATKGYVIDQRVTIQDLEWIIRRLKKDEFNDEFKKFLNSVRDDINNTWATKRVQNREDRVAKAQDSMVKEVILSLPYIDKQLSDGDVQLDTIRRAVSPIASLYITQQKRDGELFETSNEDDLIEIVELFAVTALLKLNFQGNKTQKQNANRIQAELQSQLETKRNSDELKGISAEKFARIESDIEKAFNKQRAEVDKNLGLRTSNAFQRIVGPVFLVSFGTILSAPLIVVLRPLIASLRWFEGLLGEFNLLGKSIIDPLINSITPFQLPKQSDTADVTNNMKSVNKNLKRMKSDIQESRGRLAQVSASVTPDPGAPPPPPVPSPANVVNNRRWEQKDAEALRLRELDEQEQQIDAMIAAAEQNATSTLIFQLAQFARTELEAGDPTITLLDGVSELLNSVDFLIDSVSAFNFDEQTVLNKELIDQFNQKIEEGKNTVQRAKQKINSEKKIFMKIIMSKFFLINTI